MDSDTSRSPEFLNRGNEAPNEPSSKPPSSKQLVLRREVLYPLRQNTGVGVMLVASAAMFFAVASSAFILRAQMPMPDQRCPASAEVVPAPAPPQAVEVELIEFRPAEKPELASLPCGEPVYQENEDGPSSIIFRVCDPEN